VAQVIPDTEAEGPGRRFAVWVQGCPLRCPGCCNPEMLPVPGGELRTVAGLVRQLQDAGEIEGLTLLGGEPFAQADPCAALAGEARRTGLSVMVFSGYTLAELREAGDAAWDRLLAATDLLVDGRFRRELPESRRRWVGSANQQLWFLSDRYRADDPRFAAQNSLEIRLEGGRLMVNGWPAAAAALEGAKS
jgi:anaerobic ribonucleoside-triphosphate reductase activating protein